MDSDTTRSTLLSRVRDGSDDAAWREFEARYGGLIVRYACGCGLSHADAEDIRQIVLLDLSKALRGFEYSPQRGRFRDYLGRTVKNAVSNWRARPNPVRAALDSGVMAAVPAGDEGAADARWEQEWSDHHYRLAMHTIRRTFEPRSVEVFDRILAGATIESIATTYGMSTAAVHKVKQRIRDRMKELIAAQIREEDEPVGKNEK